MLKTIATIAFVTFGTAAIAEPLEQGKYDHCNHYTWKQLIAGFRCAYIAGTSHGLLKHAQKLERMASEATDPNRAQKLRNKAAYERAEAERYADKYRRDYAPKQ